MIPEQSNNPGKSVNPINLICGDCLSEMSALPIGCVDMVFADLPYGTTQCSWDVRIPFNPLWEQLNRVVKKNAAIVFTATQPFASLLISSNIDAYKYSWIWEKSKATGFLNSKKRPLVAHEEVVVFCNGTPPYYPQMTAGQPYNKGVRKQQTDNDVYGNFKKTIVASDGGRYPRSVQYFKTAESEGKTIHKTQKPISLIEYFILTYTIKGATVLDCCMGSGSTGKAAIKTERMFIGIEKDAEIFKSARNNIQS